jgi:plasmid replication initiation protein
MPKISDNNLVEKSKSLVWAKFRDYTAGELRLLEVYLSRINPRDQSSSRVEFTLAEYRELLGLKSLDARRIEPQIKHFLGNTVSIPIDKEKGTFESFVLFTRAKLDYVPETRSYVVAITCNPDLRSIFFDIAESGYVRYRLRYTSRMKSQYSILLYSILRDWLNMDSKPHEISLKKLREQLGAMEASYDVYKNLRKRVLDVAVDEINAVSDIVVTYEPVLVARKAVAVKFKPKIKASETLIEAQASEVPAEPQKAVRKPRRSGYEDFDWSVCDELEKQDCIDVAKVVEKWMKKEHPEIKLPRRREAVYDTVKAAYKDILSLSRTPFPDRPVGYLIRSVDKAGVVDKYMPAFYFIEALNSK